MHPHTSPRMPRLGSAYWIYIHSFAHNVLAIPRTDDRNMGGNGTMSLNFCRRLRGRHFRALGALGSCASVIRTR
jgi:hypothetical protein